MCAVGNAAAEKALKAELALLAKYKHKRIVHLFGTAHNRKDSELWAVLELCDFGSLDGL